MSIRLEERITGNAYTAFAKVYDSFMKNIPYGKWKQQIVTYLRRQGYSDCQALELGCGTGSMTIRLAKEGYRMTGIDLSEEMLSRAKVRSERAGVDIFYDRQDMRALDLPYYYPVVISICDSINYLMDVEELKATLDNVYRVLLPGGIFLFDLKTEAFYKSLGEKTFTDSNEAGTYVWQNEYDEEEKNNYYNLTFFVKRPMGLYQKYEEEQAQHAFTVTQVKHMAKECGFTVKDHLGMDFKAPADLKAERMYFVLQKPADASK